MPRNEEFNILLKLKDFASKGLRSVIDLLDTIKSMSLDNVTRGLKSIGTTHASETRERIKREKEAQKAAIAANQKVLDASRREFNEKKALGEATFQSRIKTLQDELQIETLSAAQRRRLEEELSRRRVQLNRQTYKELNNLSKGFRLNLLAEAAVFDIAFQRIKSVLGGVVNIAKEAESAEAAINAISGQAAPALREELLSMSKEGFGAYSELIRGAQQLLLSGTATDDVVDTLRSISIITRTAGGDTKAAIRAVSQIATATKLRGQEALQLWNAMIPISRLLQKSLGKTGEEVENLQREGLITFPMVVKALTDGAREGTNFANAFKQILETSARGSEVLRQGAYEAFAVSLKEFITPAVVLLNRSLARLFNTLADLPKSGKLALVVISTLTAGLVGLGSIVRALAFLGIPALIKSIYALSLAIGSALFPLAAITAGITATVIVARKISPEFRKATGSLKAFINQVDNLIKRDSRFRNFWNKLKANIISTANESDLNVLKLQLEAVNEQIDELSNKKAPTNLAGFLSDTLFTGGAATEQNIQALIKQRKNIIDRINKVRLGGSSSSTESAREKEIQREKLDALLELQEKFSDKISETNDLTRSQELEKEIDHYKKLFNAKKAFLSDSARAQVEHNIAMLELEKRQIDFDEMALNQRIEFDRRRQLVRGEVSKAELDLINERIALIHHQLSEEEMSISTRKRLTREIIDLEVRSVDLVQNRNRQYYSQEATEVEDLSRQKISTQERFTQYTLQAAHKHKGDMQAVSRETANSIIKDQKKQVIAFVDIEAAKIAQWAALNLFTNPFLAVPALGAAASASAGIRQLVDNIVPFADGGIVMPTPGGTIAQIGEAGRAEAVIPLGTPTADKMLGGNQNITVVNNTYLDGKLIAKEVSKQTKVLNRKGQL